MTMDKTSKKTLLRFLVISAAAALCFCVYNLIASGLISEILFANEKNYVIITTDLTLSMQDEAEVSYQKIPLSDDTGKEAEWEPMEYWSENGYYHALLGRGSYRIRIYHPDLGSTSSVAVIDGRSDVYSLQLNYYFSRNSTSIGQSDYLETAQGDYIPKHAHVWNGHAYMILYTQKDWTDANKLCIGLGGYMATITSQEEMDFIAGILPDDNADYYWLGGYSKDGSWIWITGEDFEYQNWAEGQPDGPESGMAMQLVRNRGWDDTYNNGHRDYVRPWTICEWELADAAEETTE